MYDNPVSRYIVSGFDFGGGADRLVHVKGIKGKGGQFINMGVYDVTEVFNGGTLMPRMRLGTVADDDAYVDDFNLGAAAVAGGGASMLHTYSAHDPAFEALLLTQGRISNAVVLWTLLAATGSGLTGMATAFLDIAWDK